MIIASRTPAKIGDIITFYQRQYGDCPSAKGLIVREATLEEFMAEPHPTSTDAELAYYEKHPKPFHYEVSTD